MFYALRCPLRQIGGMLRDVCACVWLAVRRDDSQSILSPPVSLGSNPRPAPPPN